MRNVDTGESGLIMTFSTALTLSSNLGNIVKMSGNNTVAAGTDGDPVLGKIVSFSPDEDECGVQINGVIKDIPYKTGAAPTIGTIVQFSAANEVDVCADNATSTGWMVISLDTTAETCILLKA